MHGNLSLSKELNGSFSQKKTNTVSSNLISRLFVNFTLTLIFYADYKLHIISYLVPITKSWVTYIDIIFLLLFVINLISDILLFLYYYVKSQTFDISPEQKKSNEAKENEQSFKSPRSKSVKSASLSPSFILPSYHSVNSSLLSTPSSSQIDVTSPSLNASSNFSLSSSSWVYNSTPSNEQNSFETSIVRRRFPSPVLKKTSTPVYSLDSSSPYGRKSFMNQSELIMDSPENKIVNASQNIFAPLQETSSFWNFPKTFMNYLPILKRYQYQPATKCMQTLSNNDGTESLNHNAYNGILKHLNIKDEQLTNWIGNIRKWISQTILCRLTKEIDEINEILYRTGFPYLQIGEMSLLQLKQIAFTKQQTIPTLSALLPYLEITINQEYLVERLKQLACGGSMSEYKWNGGGTFRGKPWGDDLPTDSAIIFHIFCCYMDSRLPPDLYYPNGKTFTLQYFKKYLDKPLPDKDDTFYIYQAQINPPHYQVVLGKTVLDVPKGRNNLFCALLIFIHHIKEKHSGMLARVNLGPSGINILCVLQEN